MEARSNEFNIVRSQNYFFSKENNPSGDLRIGDTKINQVQVMNGFIEYGKCHTQIRRCIGIVNNNLII